MGLGMDVENTFASIKSEPPEYDTPLSDAETEYNFEENDYSIKEERDNENQSPTVDLPIEEDPSFADLFLDHESGSAIENMADGVDRRSAIDSGIPSKRHIRNAVIDYQEPSTSSGTRRGHHSNNEGQYLRLRRLSIELEHMQHDGIGGCQSQQQEVRSKQQQQQRSADVDDDDEDEDEILDQLTNNSAPEWPLQPKSPPAATLKSHDRRAPLTDVTDDDEVFGFFRNASGNMGVDFVDDDAEELLKFVEERNSRKNSLLDKRYDRLKDEIEKLGDCDESDIRMEEISQQLRDVVKEMETRKQQQMARGAREIKRKQEHQMNDYLKNTLGEPDYAAIDRFFNIPPVAATFKPRNAYEAFVGRHVTKIKSESVILAEQELRRDVQRRKERGDVAAVPPPITRRIRGEKERYLEKIRAVLVPYFDSGRINEDDYKNIAREMTRDLHDRDMDGKPMILMLLLKVKQILPFFFRLSDDAQIRSLVEEAVAQVLAIKETLGQLY